MRLATNSWGKDENGKTRTQWHSVHVFGRQAEVAAQYLEKGRNVFVEGSLDTTSSTNADGTQRWNTFITANRVTFMGGGRRDLETDLDGESSPGTEAEDDGVIRI
jgi:single-strand DNA-binding protein